MFLEALILIVGYYIFSGISFYVYAVIKSYEILDTWNFEINRDTIAGVCQYPRWLLFWLEWIVRKIKNF